MDKVDFIKGRLKKHRECRTLQDVAKAAGVSRRTLTNILNDEGAQTKTIDKLHSYFKGSK